MQGWAGLIDDEVHLPGLKPEELSIVLGREGDFADLEDLAVVYDDHVFYSMAAGWPVAGNCCSAVSSW
jgi:hypothetical protein